MTNCQTADISPPPDPPGVHAGLKQFYYPQCLQDSCTAVTWFSRPCLCKRGTSLGMKFDVYCPSVAGCYRAKRPRFASGATHVGLLCREWHRNGVLPENFCLPCQILLYQLSAFIHPSSRIDGWMDGWMDR
jgi:hypothetical protein